MSKQVYKFYNYQPRPQQTRPQTPVTQPSPYNQRPVQQQPNAPQNYQPYQSPQQIVNVNNNKSHGILKGIAIGVGAAALVGITAFFAIHGICLKCNCNTQKEEPTKPEVVVEQKDNAVNNDIINYYHNYADNKDKGKTTPAEKPTEKPTEKPAEAPTEKPTEAPTEKPTIPGGDVVQPSDPAKTNPTQAQNDGGITTAPDPAEGQNDQSPSSSPNIDQNGGPTTGNGGQDNSGSNNIGGYTPNISNDNSGKIAYLEPDGDELDQ